jgi:cytochrome c biogenesis protein CcmG/thiol:disulfide interchange protein DsbE
VTQDDLLPASPDAGSAQTGTSRRRQGAAYWLVVLAALSVVVVGVAFSGRFGADPQVVASPLIGRPVPDISVPFLDVPESEMDLTALRGEIVVVNFWASWCLSCRVEHDALVAAAAQLDELGVVFVGVNHQDQPDNAQAFLDELGRSPQTLYLEDVGSRLAFEFGVLGLPETFFVDREGNVVGKVTGPVSHDLLITTVDAIILGEDIGVVKTGEVENR